MKDIRSLTFALAIAAIALAVANPAAAEQGCSDGYKPTPRRMELNAGRFPGCTEDRAEEPPPGPLGGALGRDRHGCRFRDDRHRRQPAHRGSRHPDRHGHVPTQAARVAASTSPIPINAALSPGAATMPSRPAGGRWKSHPSTPLTRARKRLARSARSSSPIAACRCESIGRSRINHGAIACPGFLPQPLKPRCPRSGRGTFPDTTNAGRNSRHRWRAVCSINQEFLVGPRESNSAPMDYESTALTRHELEAQETYCPSRKLFSLSARLG